MYFRNHVGGWVAACLAVALAGCQSAIPTPTPADQGVAIEEVIDQVKQALTNVQLKLQEQTLPPLSQVKLSLQTVVSKKAGGSLKLLVISLGGSHEDSRTQQINLVLVPPPPGAPVKISANNITADLENAILAAAAGVRKAGEGSVPLTVGCLDVILAFSVKAGGNAELSGIELGPISAGIKGEQARASSQTLTVSFALPK